MQSSVRSPSHWDVARHGGRCSWIDAKPQTQPHPSWPCVPLPFDGSHRSLRIPRGEVDGLLLVLNVWSGRALREGWSKIESAVLR